MNPQHRSGDADPTPPPVHVPQPPAPPRFAPPAHHAAGPAGARHQWRHPHADQVYRAFRQLEVLSERTPEYERLLAEAPRTEPVTPHIERLTGRAEQVRELFRRSIDAARRTGAHLAGPYAPPRSRARDGLEDPGDAGGDPS